MDNHYEFTDLIGKDELVNDIQRLEEKIKETIGERVNLIAYTPTEDTDYDL